MYAVFQNGGKQYRVHTSQIIRLEKLNIKIGELFEFKKVLMIVNGKHTIVGVPFIAGAVITAQVVLIDRSKKIKVIKFHRRKHYRKKQGHRQWFTDVKIISINI